MESIKRGTTPTISTKVDGVEFGDIQKVEFIFKNRISPDAPSLCMKYYPGGGASYNSQDRSFDISLNESETRDFTANKTVYMDTRITLVGGSIPKTNIVQFSVIETLF